MLDNYFDKVYVITTINSKRVDYCRKQLEKAGIKNYEFATSVDYRIIDNRFQTCVHPNVPAQKYMSLCANNISLIQSAIYNKYDNICICEDDIFFKDDYKPKLKDFMNNIPENWDMLNLGYLNEENELIQENKYVYKQAGTYYGTQCVVYKNTIYSKIIEFYYKYVCNVPIDWAGRDLCKQFNVYIPVEKFIYQVSRDYGDYNLNRSNSDVMFDSLIINREIPSYYLSQEK